VVRSVPERWLIHFFQRHADDDPAQPTATIEFLDTLPDKVAAEIQAVLEAVAAAPPPSFSGGGKWEAMRDDMAGMYEVRVQGANANHRLFCLLERNADDLGGPTIVCLGGLTKEVRSSASPRDYRRIRQYADEFQKHRTVYQQDLGRRS
jgi:Txe/YoeB family toxin of Txe-Axe toxin-antitoxin module